MVPDTASSKDVILALVGITSALGGFVLVFLGVLVSEYQSFVGDDNIKEPTLGGFRRAGYGSFGTFLLCLGTVSLGVVWLLKPARWLYDAAVGSFFVVLIGLVVLSIYATFRVLLKG